MTASAEGVPRVASAGVRERARFGTLPVAFGLLGALVAYGTMRVADTPWVDAFAFHAGVGIAAVLGAGSAWAVQRLHHRPRWARARWGLVPIAGAMVGMSVQALLLRRAVMYPDETVGLTTAKPVSWILAGAPMGALPALLVMLLLLASLRMSGRVAPLDARERMIVPVAGACLVVAVGSIRAASAIERPIILLVVVLAAATLIEVLVRDAVRARWLRRAFRGADRYEVVASDELPLPGDLPAFFGGAPAGAAIIHVHGETGYRAAARSPIATTADSTEDAIRPVRRRRALAAALGAAAGIVGAASLVLAH